ncbi:helix-turn-helix domain-containing protein [Ornithinibacillus halophilus]|uniref:Tetratricopeptide repeat-containing protein n=1 Tax=Ornithinibacillus halophilus TaxID=930117 RepID=A0A1M5ETM1_9BACI|nr:helix-turn-helix domain-containing protein [Ornithinibacillus halophilus]SHF82605.1 Tetratricopeptide repeat-containing protein [Ornithinibacillus halophilus]
MEIGSFIKLQRVKQGMTQEELADGIVSMSYLSKIENQRTDASPEVISMLCTRLGIELNSEKDETIKEKCQNWFNMLFEQNDKSEIISTYEEISQLMSVVRSDNLMMFEIHKIRYFLLIGEYDKALEQINSLSEVAGSFDNTHLYYWYKFKGNYSSVIGEFTHAMRMYRLAEKKINQINISDAEQADIYYIIAITHSKLRNVLETIDYTNKAIDIFQREYNFIRCAQCHIVLGIAYRRIKMYEKAIKHYNLAKHLGGLNKNNEMIQLTNQNLGYLYSNIGDTKEGIKHFLEVVKDEKTKVTGRLMAVTNLIKEYYKIQNFDKVEEMIVVANNLLKQDKNDVYHRLYNYIVLTFEYAITNQDEKFTSLLIEEFIPYLKKQKDHANLIIYSNMIAKHYESVGRYKDSVKYYKLANLTYEEVVNL